MKASPSHRGARTSRTGRPFRADLAVALLALLAQIALPHVHRLQVAAHAEELLDRRLLAEKARAGLERLPEAYRAPFVLRDLEELATAEVAQVLGLEPATVRQRVHRARLMLRGYLSELAGVTP